MRRFKNFYLWNVVEKFLKKWLNFGDLGPGPRALSSNSNFTVNVLLIPKLHTSFGKNWPFQEVKNVWILTNGDERLRIDTNCNRSQVSASCYLKNKTVKEGVHLKSNQTARNVTNKNQMLQMPQVDILLLYKITSLSVIFTYYLFMKISKQYTVSFVLPLNLNERWILI